MWNAVLGSAHAVLLCFAIDQADSLASLNDRWLPLLWATGTEAPIFVLGLRADLRSSAFAARCLSEEQGFEFAQRGGALGYLECSVKDPESVQQVVDEVLLVAKEYYGLQWQLGATREIDSVPVDDSAADAPWLSHERLNVTDDHLQLDVETIQKNLSMLGSTPQRQHAYLRIDLADLGLTSVDAIRSFQKLQFVNVSGNRLRSLEPFGALRYLLHLNASFNLMIRTQGFTAPDQLETVDMSYNMIGELGDWHVHRYLRELNLRGNFIERVTPGLINNREIRMLDLSENYLAKIENMDGLGLNTLYLAQNRLTSLEGIASLTNLQVLNVRHNGITSISALRSEDIPRLRKLCISENRVSNITEVEGLCSFPFLCDLLLAPNPIVELPHYRAQVLHRMPNLRLLDMQAATAEEKVKADVIYGADVDHRRGIFEEQLPEESFVDRRLVTMEGIGDLELKQFGLHGDAGEFASALGMIDTEEGKPRRTLTSRTRFQEAKLRQRLEIARRGGDPPGVADFANFAAPFLMARVCDEDLPEILEVIAEGGIERLILSGAGLGTAGILELLAALQKPGPLHHLDLSGCEAVAQCARELLKGLPYSRGCSIEAAGCGLSESDENKLRNQTPEAMEALAIAAEERSRTAEIVATFLARQEALEDFATENCSQDGPPAEPAAYLYHPQQWRDGIEARALASYNDFCSLNPEGVRQDGDSSQWSMIGPDKRNIMISGDQNFVLNQKRLDILREWGCTLEEYEGELEEGEGNDVSLPRLGGRSLPAAYAEAFAPVAKSTGLLAFMVWNGCRPDEDMVAERRRQREEWEQIWRDRMKNQMALSAAAAKMYDSSQRPANVASGQIIAHFTYLALSCTLKGGESTMGPEQFNLKWLRKNPRSPARHGEDLHQLLAMGKVSIESATGCSFGTDSVELKLKNLTSSEDLEVAIAQGSIFQHVDWQHRQNLLIAVDYVLPLPAAASVTKKMMAHCMNFTCACSNGNPMNLTEFYFDDAEVMATQYSVWQHFQSRFSPEVASTAMAQRI
mmetsp:Transcript_127111/g.219313  ORF Transcript_127111/g.219313 Transcript_127111/m.219313 type:complete len:1030 (-) Transcript_127111:224-3313(-)